MFENQYRWIDFSIITKVRINLLILVQTNIMTIQEAQKTIDNWILSTGVRYFNELTNMAILTEEVGEVARIMARKYGEQSFKELDKDKDLGDELADVLFVLICIANQTGIDLTTALEKNLVKKTERDSNGIKTMKN